MTHRNVSLGMVLLLAVTAPVAAQQYVEYGVALSLGLDYIEHYEQGPVAVGPVAHEDIIPGYGRVYGIANVGPAVNKARVDLAGTNPDNPLIFEYGFSTSRYWDTFRFDDPALNGTHGFFEVTLYVAGSGYVDLSPVFLNAPDLEFDAFWHAVINVTVDGVTDPFGSPVQSGYYYGEWYKGFGSTTLDYFGDPLNTYQQTITYEFIYGQPIYMDTFLQIDTSIDNQYALANGTLDTVIDLGNSSYWGGIRNLRDASGKPVTTATYSSSSGIDYRQSAAPLHPGDIDGNGLVDTADMILFVGVLLGTETNPVYVGRSDLNGDTARDGRDIQPFLAAMLAP
ncbi:MAG: hypothetical protein U1A27_05710 [Phycisphaerae bacterium]